MDDDDDDAYPPCAEAPIYTGLRPPLVERPLYLSGAPVPPAVADACRRAAPIAAAVGGALLGAVAAYFVPRFLDRAVGGFLEPPDDDDYVDIEVDDR